jgi:ABC-type transport system substrate-binding protein
VRFPRSTRLSLFGPLVLVIAGCGKEEPCRRCDTVVVAAIGEPASILPPLVVDFAVFQARLGQGRFDSYIGAWLDEPTPRGLADQWGRSGWAAINYGRYANPVFDSLLAMASREPGVERASGLYREAMETLNADAPAIFLYAPANTAVAARRMENVEIDPYSWASGLTDWEVAGP